MVGETLGYSECPILSSRAEHILPTLMVMLFPKQLL